VKHYDSAAAAAATVLGLVGAYGVLVFGFAIASVVLTLMINWRVAAKAGYHGGMSLLLLIPFVNLAALIMFAFTTWPIERRLAVAEGTDQLMGYQPPVQIR
jgi:hypothetical protein